MRARISSVLLLVGALAACAEQGAGPERVALARNPLNIAPAIGVDSVTGASIETNQDDYAPGEVVHVVGKGWTPGETVNLYMTEEPDTHGPVSMDVVADSAGGFSVHFYDVQVHDLGSTFTLTATGAVSGSEAVAVFTDANLRLIHSGGTLSNFNAAVIAYSSSTNCTTGGASPQIKLVTSTGGGGAGATQANAAAEANQSARFGVPKVVGSHSFTGFALASGTTTDTASTATADSAYLCVRGFGSEGQIVWRANYAAGTPNLTIDKSHTGDFTRGTTGTYSIVVSNIASATASTSGTVTVTDNLPSGLTINSVSGTGWSCPGNAFPCTRSDALAPGASYDAITLVVNVSASAAASVTNIATVSGGGDASTDNNTDSDQTNVVSANATVAVTANPVSPTVYGQPVTFTATVSGASGTPTGSVTFWVGACDTGTQIGNASVALVAGSASSVSTTTLPVASNTITACYSGDNTYNSTSGTTTHVVNKADVLVTMSASPDPSKFGQSVALSATVTAVAPGDGTPTGVIKYYDGGSCTTPGNQIGTTASVATPGTSTTTLAVNSYTLVACYEGDGNFNANGDTEAHTVEKADVVVTMSATPDPSNFGASVSLSATVTAAPPGAGTPAGVIKYYDGGTCTTPGNQIGSTASVAAPGTSTSVLPVGNHTLLACYEGNASFNANGDTETHTVNPAPTTTVASVTTTTPQYSDEATLRAVVTPDIVNGSELTGTVRFYFRTAAFSCPATLPASGFDASDAIAAADDGVAQVDYAIPVPAGDYYLTACFYSSNTDFANSDDVSDKVTVGEENSTVTPGTPYGNAFSIGGGGTASFTLTFLVRETYSPEPDPNAGALPGNLDNAGLRVDLTAVGAGANNTFAVCTTSGTITTPAYSDVKTFTCTFTGVAVDAYEVSANVTGGYFAGSYTDALTVYDPAAGFVTGGGKFLYPDQSSDRVSFGLVFNFTGKGKTTPRGNLVVIRHLENGDVCRIKSNAIDAPAVVGNTASFSGKGNYGCVRPDGTTYDGIGNQVITGWVEDNGQGSNATAPDRFWVRMAVPNSVLAMPTTAVNNAAPLTGGNLQVPQPSRK